MRAAEISCLVAAFLQLSAPAGAMETSAHSAILTHYQTGEVLFAKHPDQQVPPASLAKLMTVEVVFHRLEEGEVRLDDVFEVSERAWRVGGARADSSTSFLPLGSEVNLRDLLKGIIVQSGNDAAITVAEGLEGSVESFAAAMNERAEDIGLAGSHFTNPHGLPDPGQRVTVRDLALLAAHLICEYPQFFGWFSQEKFTYNDITQYNHNPLLDVGIGADGLKTGYTDEAGYSLVASAVQDRGRLILVLSGLDTQEERADEA